MGKQTNRKPQKILLQVRITVDAYKRIHDTASQEYPPGSVVSALAETYLPAPRERKLPR